MSDTSDEKKNEVRFSQEQYDLLMKCSEIGDMTEWNEWRREHQFHPVLLEGAKFDNAQLDGADLRAANLRNAHFRKAKMRSADLEDACLQDAQLTNANLQGSNFIGANLKHVLLRNAILAEANLTDTDLQRAQLMDTDLRQANLSDARLREANLMHAILIGAELSGAKMYRSRLVKAKLQRAKLLEVDLREANLCDAELQESDLTRAQLQNGNLFRAKTQRTNLTSADLRGAYLSGTSMEGADCTFCIVDGGTRMDDCTIDDKTDFTGVGLASARIDPGLRARLEGNIRKKRWQAWCRAHWYNRPVELFWMLSDYGRSTGRLIGWFAAFAALFALVYWTWGYCNLTRGGNPADPGIISKLFVADNHQISAGLALVRSVYFSLVTMTTLGFGDMHANPGSYWGHILLSLQVLIGYVLLAALVTRLAVLFTGSGPESK